MTRYHGLVLAVVIAALVVGGLARLPRTTRTAPEPAPVPVVDLAIEVRDGVLAPEVASVPKDHRVRLVVTNAGTRSTSLSLAGYTARVSCDSLAPGARWATEFVADLPGDDFAWMVGGQPAGRLAVTGSHLIEGHR
jgi:hypothetical protein